jgi:hypothetical protein
MVPFAGSTSWVRTMGWVGDRGEPFVMAEVAVAAHEGDAAHEMSPFGSEA